MISARCTLQTPTPDPSPLRGSVYFELYEDSSEVWLAVILLGRQEMDCPRCGRRNLARSGLKDGYQRYRCRDCGRYCTDKPPRFTPQIKALALDMYVNSVGIRKIARFVGASPAGVLKWIRKEHDAMQARLAQQAAPAPPAQAQGDVIEMDEIYTIIQKKRSGRSSGPSTAGA